MKNNYHRLLTMDQYGIFMDLFKIVENQIMSFVFAPPTMLGVKAPLKVLVYMWCGLVVLHNYRNCKTTSPDLKNAKRQQFQEEDV
jgi:hypothetical protein